MPISLRRSHTVVQWEAYTLGRAPPALEPGADLTVAQEAAIAANIELARNAGSRYLVQRWADGTYCEKTGRKREIEIQVRCPRHSIMQCYLAIVN